MTDLEERVKELEKIVKEKKPKRWLKRVIYSIGTIGGAIVIGSIGSYWSAISIVGHLSIKSNSIYESMFAKYEPEIKQLSKQFWDQLAQDIKQGTYKSEDIMIEYRKKWYDLGYDYGRDIGIQGGIPLGMGLTLSIIGGGIAGYFISRKINNKIQRKYQT